MAAFLEILASGLRAGRTPPEAARLACDVVDGEPVARLRAAVDRGEDLGAALGASARTDPRWRMVAHAWALSARTGAPLADAMDAAAGVVRAHQDRARHVESASAGARATIRILTALPLGGPVLALAVGVDPAGAYASPTAWACLVGGVVLVLVGRRWVASLVRSAVTGPVLAAR
ncbi:MAG: type II secretion system F family protein [Mobilicoccus sp.]|nr:type II secretion system F family protein [Mobilicoccus sp.]